jgi:hypothetical protein
MLFLIVVIFAALIAFGVWRRFTAIQWIWLLAGAAFALILLWFLVLVLFIGPEMRRMGPPGG